jgi:hypothetical protein
LKPDQKLSLAREGKLLRAFLVRLYSDFEFRLNGVSQLSATGTRQGDLSFG